MPRWIKRGLLCFAWLVVWLLLYGLSAGLLQARDNAWREESVNRYVSGEHTAGGRYIRGHTVIWTVFSSVGWMGLLAGGALIFYWTRDKSAVKQPIFPASPSALP